MHYRGYRIKFFARSFDLRLYELSRAFYEGAGYPCVRLTDQSADGYFDTMLSDTECDIAINVDEDCFVADMEAVWYLVDLCIDGGYANIGCPDGGGNAPRHGNPVVTNPFFNVFNLTLIRTKYSRAAVKQYDYAADKERLMRDYPRSLLLTRYDFDNKSYVEPYYPLFLWLAGNFDCHYLPTRMHADGISTMLYDGSDSEGGRLLCAHSWFARYYSTPSWLAHTIQKVVGKQQDRIDSLIDEIHAIRGTQRSRETLTDTLRYNLDKCVRWTIKVPQRIAGWPKKIQRRLSGKGRWEL